jgi:glycosyltransferase involved in cell wall biosynthesis
MGTIAPTPKGNRLTRLIFLLGKRDVPTDGVQDYCEYLGQALQRRGIQTEIVCVEWDSKGWRGALRKLWEQSAEWTGAWVVLQYTALGWSRRGFPLGVLAVLRNLRRRKLRRAAVFHDSRRQGGAGWARSVRGPFQDWIIRRIYGEIDAAILADPLESIEWLPKNSDRAAFVPIGANLPERQGPTGAARIQKPEGQTVAVFCLSDPPNVSKEVGDISHAVRMAANGRKLRIVFLGRGTAEAREEIRRAFEGIPAEISVLGVVEGLKVREILSESDVMVSVRGLMYPRRGSAIAGIACGLPILGYGSKETCFPISEAGLRLVRYRDAEALGANLTQVLSDEGLREQLSAASRAAQEKFFSWNSIADRMIEALNRDPDQT